MRKAIDLHPTNAVYHRALTELLEKMGEDKAHAAKEQRRTAVNAHIIEANYFLSGQSLEELAHTIGYKIDTKVRRIHIYVSIHVCMYVCVVFE